MKVTSAGLMLLLLLCVRATAAETLTAELAWMDRVELGVPVSGVVESVTVRPGQTVDKGALLLQLDRSVFLAEAEAARMAVKALQGNRDEARQELERAEALYEQTVLSDHDLQLARLAFDQAEADYQQARARLVKARFDLDHASLMAPFAARVLERHIMPNEVLIQDRQAKVLLVLARRDVMQARTAVPAARLARLSPGDPVSVRVGDKAYPGRITELGLLPRGGQFPVVVEFAVSGEDALFPGMSADVELP